MIDKVIKDGNKQSLSEQKQRLASKAGKRVTFVLADSLKDIPRAFRNIKNSNVLPFRSLNAYEVFLGGTIIMDKDIFGKTKTKETK